MLTHTSAIIIIHHVILSKTVTIDIALSIFRTYTLYDQTGGGWVQKLRENPYDTNESKFLRSFDIM